MKKILALLTALLLTAALAAPSALAFSFTDIPENSSLKSEVEKSVSDGLMNGYSAVRFGYSDTITRAQFAAVLVRMMGWKQVTPTAASYSDVPPAHTWYATIETAVSHDVTDAGGSFRPSAAITRAEMSEMLVRALGLKGAAALMEKSLSAGKITQPFTDVSGSGAAYITVAYEVGMTKGTSASTFAPNATATRAQAAAMLVRIYEKLHQNISWSHGFYAISSHSQLSLAKSLSAVSAGWGRMIWDGSKAVLSTTSASGNEFAIPSGYSEVTDYLQSADIPLNLSVYMDTSEDVAGLLDSADGRAQAVEQITNELTVSYKAIGKNPYSGVTIDFEGLRSSQKSNFNAFLTALAAQVKALNKTLYVCVSPVLTTGSYYDGYDYRTIGSLADRVILMAYDYDAHDLSSYVGTEYYKTAASAPLDQIYMSLLAITDADTGVQDLSKVALGYSAKSVAWKIDSAGKLLSGTPIYPDNATVAKRLGQSGTTLGWSSAYQLPYAIYTADDGGRYFLWYENETACESALNAAKLLGISGVSLWRLGIIPDSSLWSWSFF